MFGQRLKESRKARGFTLIDISKKLGVSFETISRYENERREPDLNTLKKLCYFYNVSSDYILGITNNKKI